MYVGNAGYGGYFRCIKYYLDYQIQRKMYRRKLPYLTKIISVVLARNVPWAQEFFKGVGIKVTTGSQ